LSVGSVRCAVMRRSYKFLSRPTARQVVALAACLEDHRALHNAALAERRDAFRMRGHTVRYADQSGQLSGIRRADPLGRGRWSFSSQQATLRRLDRAMAAFFRRVRAGAKPGYFSSTPPSATCSAAEPVTENGDPDGHRQAEQADDRQDE